MLKYFLLFILNVPFVVLGLGRTMQAFSSKRISRLRLVLNLVFWGVLGVVLFLAEPIFRYLQINKLTDSTPLSLYDVAAITAGIFSVFMIYRLYSKLDRLEQRLNQLNREASIKFSEQD